MENKDKFGYSYTGIYRGIVLDNIDPEIHGRLKIYVPEVYGEAYLNEIDRLPWAEPVMSLFGGNWTNDRSGDLNTETGVTTIPHTSKLPGKGAEVWLFFERGNQNFPKYFAACQGGEGWHSEHHNQHVIRTDNVTIKVNEMPMTQTGEDDDVAYRSISNKPNSYNNNCTSVGTKPELSKAEMVPRLDIEIVNKNPKDAALNLKIKGNVNVFIEGNVYEEIVGDKFETHTGRLYRKHDGDSVIEENGNITYKHDGKKFSIIKGNYTTVHDGNDNKSYSGNTASFVFGNDSRIVKEMTSLVTFGAQTNMTVGQKTEVVAGGRLNAITGEDVNFQLSQAFVFSGDLILGSLAGNVYIQAFTPGKKIVMKAATVETKAQTQILDAVQAGTIDHNLDPSINIATKEYPT